MSHDNINKNLLDNAASNFLSKHGVSEDKLQSIFKLANSMIDNNKKKINKNLAIDDAYTKMIKYQNEEKTLPDKLDKAEEDYYSLKGWSWPNEPNMFFSGPAANNNRKFYNNLQKAKISEKQDLDNNVDLIKELNTLVDSYESSTIYAGKMRELLEVKDNEYNNISNALSDMKNVSQTNDRRVVYENQEIQGLHFSRKIIYLFYYSAFFIYLIFGDFLSNKRYLSVKFWIYILSYLILPFITNYIIIIAFKIYTYMIYFFMNNAPRDVYTTY